MARKANEDIRSNSGHKQTGEHICEPVTCSCRNYFVENRERYRTSPKIGQRWCDKRFSSGVIGKWVTSILQIAEFGANANLSLQLNRLSIANICGV
ncbi:hypothetical protein G5I_05924 [Acromyrmex echinatior]|uniref:Uncharacterized protein n=1 Tax=Acromyrmex echinatior TaxID=103372 RepID=F4WJP3_ACREC|nr:hypothetical protein G5I_05924 [Acromyrmex echinatior]